MHPRREPRSVSSCGHLQHGGTSLGATSVVHDTIKVDISEIQKKSVILDKQATLCAQTRSNYLVVLRIDQKIL